MGTPSSSVAPRQATDEANRGEDGVAVSVPHFVDPAQREPALDPDQVVHGQSGEHRQPDRNDQERADGEREGELQSEESRGVDPISQPAAATVDPAAVRASASTTQVIAPSTKLSAAAIAMLAESVNSV